MNGRPVEAGERRLSGQTPCRDDPRRAIEDHETGLVAVEATLCVLGEVARDHVAIRDIREALLPRAAEGEARLPGRAVEEAPVTVRASAAPLARTRTTEWPFSSASHAMTLSETAGRRGCSSAAANVVSVPLMRSRMRGSSAPFT